MRRNPSPEAGRSETTAELIARISAERDAPLRSTARHAIVTAPARATTATPVRRPRRPAAGRAVSTDTDPRMHAYRPAPRDDEPSELRTGPIDLTALARAAAPVPAQRTGTRPGPAPVPDTPRPRRDAAPVVVDDVLHEPAADEASTGAPRFVAPGRASPRRTTRLALSVGLVAVAMVLVGSAAAGWFGGTGPAAPADPAAVIAPVDGTGAGPAPTGPTVPAPVNGLPAEAAPAAPEPAAPEPAAPEPAAPGPADEVRLTDEAPADPYGY